MSSISLAERFTYGRPVAAHELAEPRVADRPLTALIGRVLLGTIFIGTGTTKFANTADTVAYMGAYGLPQSELFALVVGLGEILGGLLILSGLIARVGALYLALYLIPTTIVFHNFWALEGEARDMQLVQALKNLSILGGLLLLVAHGPGRYSLDGLLRRSRRATPTATATPPASPTPASASPAP
jgi:putative oxidoreductase